MTGIIIHTITHSRVCIVHGMLCTYVESTRSMNGSIRSAHFKVHPVANENQTFISLGSIGRLDTVSFPMDKPKIRTTMLHIQSGGHGLRCIVVTRFIHVVCVREASGSTIVHAYETLICYNYRTHNMRPHCHFDWRMGIGCATLGMDQ